MPGIESAIEGSKKLTRIFGDWPSFHDAEVIELHLWRGDVETAANRWIFPVLTVKMHLWELTSEVSAQGTLISRHHTLATLRFHNVHDFVMNSAFNHQNAIFELSVEFEDAKTNPKALLVNFTPAHGMGATFKCFRMEVLEANPCTAEGELIK